MASTALAESNRLREHRERAGLTQERLAVLAECSFFTVSRLERGEQRPHLSTARRIANALGVTVDDLWPELEKSA